MGGKKGRVRPFFPSANSFIQPGLKHSGPEKQTISKIVTLFRVEIKKVFDKAQAST